jgi:Gamma-glutamyl cyclotransferase, AIG2-like
MAEDTVLMFLNGTAMSGQKDHGAICNSRFLGDISTAPGYRFYAVRDEFPGLVPVEAGGASIVGELYEIELEVWRGSLLPSEPEELVPGTVVLIDGRTVQVMTLELDRVKPGDKLVDISDLGSWRRYQSQING